MRTVQATRDRSAVKTAGGKIIRVEAHPIPEHPRPKRVQGRAGLVGDAAGYVTKCSGAWVLQHSCSMACRCLRCSIGHSHETPCTAVSLASVGLPMLGFQHVDAAVTS